MATPVDFPKYLQSLVNSYETKYRRFYTLTDLQVEVRVEISPKDRSPQTSKNKPETKIDRLEVLSGIRKYLRDGNVLLVGKPRFGKIDGFAAFSVGIGTGSIGGWRSPDSGVGGVKARLVDPRGNLCRISAGKTQS